MAVMLVLLMEGMHEMHRWNGLGWEDVCTKGHGDWFTHLSNITVITATIWEAVMLVLLMKGFME
jgi:hypothetical protein